MKNHMQRNSIPKKHYHKKGASLLELIVSLFIIVALFAATFPVISKVRQKARRILTMNNLRQIVLGVNQFAADNSYSYPKSVATIGSTGTQWNWQEPTILISARRRDRYTNRSVSAYLRSYIDNADIFFCPNAPKKYKYLKESWEAGDRWDNPETVPTQDPVIGAYCLYWNYTGYLSEEQKPFIGPHSPSGKRRESKLLVSDYFGFGHWRNKSVYGSRDAYGSCEKLETGSRTPGTEVSSDFWSRWCGSEKIGLDEIKVELNAGYADGHVERYSVAEVVPMEVSKNPQGTLPYPESLSPGIFYLPAKALH